MKNSKKKLEFEQCKLFTKLSGKYKNYKVEKLPENHFGDCMISDKNEDIFIQIRFTDEEYKKDWGINQSHAKWSDKPSRLLEQLVKAVNDKSQKYSLTDKSKSILLLIGGWLFDEREWIDHIKPQLKYLVSISGFREIWFLADDGRGVYLDKLSK